MADAFAGATREQLIRLVADYPMAWIVPARGGAAPAFMPLLLDVGDDAGDGILGGTLIGHLPRRHPLVASFEQDGEARFLFTGPNSYISPAWLGDRNWAPTWNFCTATLTADVALWADGIDTVLERTVAQMEAGRERPWTVDELGLRYAALRAQVIAFRARITAVVPRMKLGQDERPDVRREIIAGLGDHPLAEWMRHATDAQA